MIITDKFVYVHMPKTGGTFVSTILKKIHEARGDKVIERRSDYQPTLKHRIKGLLDTRAIFLMLLNEEKADVWNQHGRVSQIPEEHRHKPVLTTIRNPYDRYVSQYEFEWWKNNREETLTSESQQKVLEQYPHFPEISFEEFVHLSNEFFYTDSRTRFSPEIELGRHTLHFMRYFYPDPSIIPTIDHQYLAEKRYLKDLHQNIHFTFTDTLNQNLYDYLLTMGYDPAEIEFVKSHGKIFPKRGGRTNDQKWQEYYTPEIKEWVHHRERLIFELFPRFNV